MVPSADETPDPPKSTRRAQAMAHGDLFSGLVVRLVGFSDEEEHYYRDAVEMHGGTLATGYKLLGTHIIAHSETTCFDDPICERARRPGSGCAMVNEFWFEDAIDEGYLPDQEIVTYKLPHSLQGITCLPTLRVCIAGFDDTETRHAKRIASLIGASVYDQFEEDTLTHVICKSPDCKEYAEAKIAGIPVVKQTWIEECLFKWKIVPVETHMDFSFKKYISTPTYSGFKSFYTPSCAKSDRTHMPATTGQMRDRSPSNPSRIRRALEYPESDVVNVSDYLKSINKLTQAVHVPRYPVQQTETNPDVKFVLLKAYGLIHDEHLEEQSLGGLFSFSDFLMSLKSKAMKLQKVARWSLTKVSKQADVERFADCCEEAFGGKEHVPWDVYVWLQSMRKRVDGFVLRRHIHMLDPSETFEVFIGLFDAFMGLSAYEKRSFNKLESMKEYVNWSSYHFRWVVLDESLDSKKAMVRAMEEDKARKMQMPMGINGNAEIEPYIGDVRGLVPFIRDTFAHPAKDYKIYMLTVMMIEFRQLLASLQEELFLLGKLPGLKH